MECPVVSRAKPAARISVLGRQFPSTPAPSGLCLGSVFDNITLGQFPSNATGDFVFKSQRPLQILVRAQPEKNSFGFTGGMIEAYGPAGSDGKRELLGRADIVSLRGEFLPKLSGCNITGSINITDLELTQSTPLPIRARVRQMTDPTLAKLTQLATPLLAEMFNTFLGQYAQFPLPLIDGYECTSAELRWTERTMQIDSDIRILPDSTRTKKTK